MFGGAARRAGSRWASWTSDSKYENPTSYPAPGQVILHPGGVSETEILLAYGSVQFASKVGVLAGNHFLTVTDGAGASGGARPHGALGRRAGDYVRVARQRA